MTVHKIVYKIDPSDNHIIKKYASITEAAKDNKMSMVSIQNALKKDSRLSKGFKWFDSNDVKSVLPGEE